MKSEDAGKLLLRVTVGALLLLHGISKLKNGIGGISNSVTSHGLPSFVAYGVYIGEVLAPLALIVGFYARIAAAIVAFNMAVAVGLSHSSDLFHLGKGGGYALELQALYFVGALTAALIGPGRYAARA